MLFKISKSIFVFSLFLNSLCVVTTVPFMILDSPKVLIFTAPDERIASTIVEPDLGKPIIKVKSSTIPLKITKIIEFL